ncbi:hypothetical protein [Phormidium sp. CCY1219]|uniref:hypothetical protein n=1 Tax=Phormidium sp. CCY1219 TaxID=2886104 RepID=UPI002D1F2B90|nr:hypothetical protein [Phormidium sp. CCY1219]MEB3829251.1 hypothetical protein [Phormidium sp. CCY1219]
MPRLRFGHLPSTFAGTNRTEWLISYHIYHIYPLARVGIQFPLFPCRLGNATEDLHLCDRQKWQGRYRHCHFFSFAL